MTPVVIHPVGLRLVGRDPMLAALRAGAQGVTAGRGRLILVTGEAGIGKTELLATIAAETAGSGALVVWAHCWEGDGAPAYWPWIQVLRAGVTAGGDPGEAAILLPDGTSQPVVKIPAESRFRVFDAMVSFLSQLAELRPVVVVVLDDLHWADEGSLRLLEFAAGHLTERAVLLLGGYRDEEASDRLRQLAGRSERVSLAGLTRTEVAALMTGLTGIAPPGPVAADVWRRTGGNPFLARELTRLLVARGGYTRQTAAPEELLATVGDILERRLARLSQPCADLLAVAAVAGPAVRLQVLARVFDDPDVVPALLDEAVDARVMRQPSSPAGPYQFSHDLFREVILTGLPTDRRTTLHLAVGRVLESLRDGGVGVHPAELAAHFAAAAAAAPVEAARHSDLAGREAISRLAFEEARHHYERALAARELTGEVESADHLDLLLRLGDAQNRAGDADAAQRTLREAARLARARQDPTEFARAAVGIHELGWRQTHTEAIAVLEEARQALPAGPSVLRAMVLASLARDLHHAWDEGKDWTRAQAAADEAVHIAQALRDPHTLAFCLLARHDAGWRPGTAGDRLPVIDEMLAASELAGDPDLVAQARLLRATALIELGDPDGPTELAAYCRRSEELGHARARHGALSRRATAAVITGDLNAARSFADQALALGRDIGEPDARGVYETLRWAINWATGTWQGSDADATGGPGLDSNPWPDSPLIEAVQQVAAGDLGAARRCLARLNLDHLLRRHDLEMLTFAAQAVAVAGTPGQLSQVYELLHFYAGRHIVVGGCAAYYGAVDHHLGILARSAGRADAAREHFENAAALHQRLGAPAWASRSRDDAYACRTIQADQACVFRRNGGVWTIIYQGTESHLPDSKGLRDLAVLLASPGQAVHSSQLHTGHPPRQSAAPLLDDQAKAAYRRRLAELESDIDEAEDFHDSHRAERARSERDALIAELSTAVGLGGRDRRLGDERERARKAVTARIREAITRIHRTNPALGDHLRATVQTGTWCTYAPPAPIHWNRSSAMHKSIVIEAAEQ